MDELQPACFIHYVMVAGGKRREFLHRLRSYLVVKKSREIVHQETRQVALFQYAYERFFETLAAGN